MATLKIFFSEPSPAPAFGYEAQYRPQGSSAAYDIASGSSSPIIVNNLPNSTPYEGTVYSVCNVHPYTVSTAVPWTADATPGVRVSSSLPGSSITGVSGISGFSFSGPLASGDTQTGNHNAFTGSITVTANGSASDLGSLSLVVNDTLVECVNISSGGNIGTHVFASSTYLATDVIFIHQDLGSCD